MTLASIDEDDDAASRGLSALDSSVSGLSGLFRVQVMGQEQDGADSLRGAVGTNSAAPQRPPPMDVNHAHGGIAPNGGNGTDRDNGADRGNDNAVNDDNGGIGAAFDDDADGIDNATRTTNTAHGIDNADGIDTAADGSDAGGNEVMHTSPAITPGVPFNGLNEEELPDCAGCHPPSWMLIRPEVRYQYLVMLECGITTAVVFCSRRQEPIPWSHLDIDGLLIEGPPDILLSLLSPMAVDLCHYTHQPDWQRGDGNWTCLVTGTALRY